MTDYGFVQSKSDFCLFTLHDSGKSVKMVVYIHVDDGHCGYVNDEDWDQFFGALSAKFPTKDLGPLDNLTKVQIEDLPGGGCHMHQANNINTLLSDLGMTDCNSVATPMEHRFCVTNYPDADLICPIKFMGLLGRLL